MIASHRFKEMPCRPSSFRPHRRQPSTRIVRSPTCSPPAQALPAHGSQVAQRAAQQHGSARPPHGKRRRPVHCTYHQRPPLSRRECPASRPTQTGPFICHCWRRQAGPHLGPRCERRSIPPTIGTEPFQSNYPSLRFKEAQKAKGPCQHCRTTEARKRGRSKA